MVIRMVPSQSIRDLPGAVTAIGHYAALDVSLDSTPVCIIDREGRVVLAAAFGDDPDVAAKRLASHRLQLSASGPTPEPRLGSCAAAPSVGASMGLTPAAGGGATVADGQLSMMVGAGRVMPPWLIGELPDQGRAASVGGPSYALHG
jgi:hypothetical protein